MRLWIILLFFVAGGVSIHAGLQWGFHHWTAAYFWRVFVVSYGTLLACVFCYWLLDRLAGGGNRAQRGFEIKGKK